jgi:hypothetical protein
MEKKDGVNWEKQTWAWDDESKDCSFACCQPRAGYCIGNADSDQDVDCPKGFDEVEDAYNTKYNLDAEKLLVEQYSTCCHQPKCKAYVEAVPASCDDKAARQNVECKEELGEDWIAQFRKDGTLGSTSTCDWKIVVGKQLDEEGTVTDPGYSLYAEKTGITKLPADPDWKKLEDGELNDIEGIPITQNMAECCDFRMNMCKGNTPGKGDGEDIDCTDLGGKYKGFKDKDTYYKLLKDSYGEKGESRDDEYLDKQAEKCCVKKTCADYAGECALVPKKLKSNPTEPAKSDDNYFSWEPNEDDCCEDIVNQCTGNTDDKDNVECPKGLLPIPNDDKDELTYDHTLDDEEELLAEKYERCCYQPQCVKYEAYVPAKCENIPADAQVPGTCTGKTVEKSKTTVPKPDWSLGSGLEGVEIEADSEYCCDTIEGQCFGNTDPNDDVECPEFATKIEGKYDVKLEDDALEIDKIESCCKQPDCIKNVEAKAATCQGEYKDGVFQVRGTCDLSKHYKEKQNFPAPDDSLSDLEKAQKFYDTSKYTDIPECCVPTTNMCADNTDEADFSCPKGYTDKENKKDISKPDGEDVPEEDIRDKCCDVMTCKHLSCEAERMEDSNDPTFVSGEGNEPTEDECCTPIEGLCRGNTKENDDIACSSSKGYKDKDGIAKLSIAEGEDGVDVCCDPLTCADYECALERGKHKADPVAGSYGSYNDCCVDIEYECAGNKDTDQDVKCWAIGQENKPEGGSYTLAVASSDDPTEQELEEVDAINKAVKYSTCCQRPKCKTHKAKVESSCDSEGNWVAGSDSEGSCNLLYFTERDNIATLPLDATPLESKASYKEAMAYLQAAEYRIDVDKNDNPSECCIHLPRCISDETRGSAFVGCEKCKWAIDYHVSEVTDWKCSGENQWNEELISPNKGPICPQRITPAPTAQPAAASVAELAAEVAQLEAGIVAIENELEPLNEEILVLNASIIEQEAAIATMPEGAARTAAEEKLADDKAKLNEKVARKAELEKTLEEKKALLATKKLELADAKEAEAAANARASNAAALQVGIMSFFACTLCFMLRE